MCGHVVASGKDRFDQQRLAELHTEIPRFGMQRSIRVTANRNDKPP